MPRGSVATVRSSATRLLGPPALLRPAALLWLAAGLAATALVSGCSGTPAPTPSSSAASPRPKMGLTVFAPDQRVPVTGVSGPTLDGPRLSLNALRGHVVVVNVWASFCKPCRTESPLLAQLADRLRPHGVRFVGVDEQDLARKGRAFVKQAGTDYPHLIDAYGKLLEKLPTLPDNVIPSTLVIDPQGRAAARFVGVVNPRQLAGIVRRAGRDS